MWNQDHFGFPINARPYSAIGTIEKVEIAEVLNEIVKKACLFEKPKVATPSTSTTTTTTAYRKGKAEAAATTANEVAATEKEVDHVLVEPVVAEAAYPNLVSNNKMNSPAIFTWNGWKFISRVRIKYKN